MQERVTLGERMQQRHPVAIHRGRQPNMEVQVEWHCDLLGEVSAECASLRVRVTDEFGLIPAQRDGVVTMPGARRPQRSLSRNLFRQLLRVGDVSYTAINMDPNEQLSVELEPRAHRGTAPGAGRAPSDR